MLALNLMFFINDQISQFINCHAPCRKLSKHEIKLSTKAWITKDILAKIRYRDKLYSQIMKSKQPDPNLIYLHKKFRNSVVKHIKASKSYYLKNYFLCNRNNVKKIWSGTRSIINISKLKLTIFPSFKKVANLLTIPVPFPTFLIIFLLMRVETPTKIFHRGIAVLSLF